MIRLRLPRSWFNGKQKYMSLGLETNPLNRQIAMAKACLMQSDYIYDRFDFSLSKYKMHCAPTQPQLGIDDVFALYLEFKSKILQPSSVKNLKSVNNKLKNIPIDILKSPKKIKTWLIDNVGEKQAKRDLVQLSASANWGVEQEIFESNPFEELDKIRAKPSHEDPDPFSERERDEIIEAFRKYQPHYYNFVRFLFFTGCRPSEAAGLKWKNVNLNENYIIFCEAIVEGKRKSETKTGITRKFPINNQLRKIIEYQTDLKDTVFYSEKIKDININNFTRRPWKRVFSEINIRYRSTYHCRHTFITLCLKKGIAPQDVGKWVGNSARMIFDHYAGLTDDPVPDF